MNRVLLAASAVLPAGLFLAGCTADAETDGRTPTTTATPTISEVLPDAWLTTAAGQVAGEPGTRCWANACIDLIGPVTAPNPSLVDPGETVAIDFEHGPPSEVTYAWVPARSPVPTPGPKGLIAWSGLFPPITDPSATGLEAPAEPGPYILIATAYWHGEGDISYGFYLDVR